MTAKWEGSRQLQGSSSIGDIRLKLPETHTHSFTSNSGTCLIHSCLCLKRYIRAEQPSKIKDLWSRHSSINYYSLSNPSKVRKTLHFEAHLFLFFSPTFISLSQTQHWCPLTGREGQDLDAPIASLQGSVVETAPSSPPRTHLTLSRVCTFSSSWKEIILFIIIIIMSPRLNIDPVQEPQTPEIKQQAKKTKNKQTR